MKACLLMQLLYMPQGSASHIAIHTTEIMTLRSKINKLYAHHTGQSEGLIGERHILVSDLQCHFVTQACHLLLSGEASRMKCPSLCRCLCRGDIGEGHLQVSSRG